MMSTTSYKSPQSRRRRKLPTVQRDGSSSLSNSTMFWFSYQSALQWIRNHEDVISKCVQLLQIYPNLIQDVSMDRFWEFIEPLVLAGRSDGKDVANTEMKLNFNVRGSAVSAKGNKLEGKGPEIPHISVTESTDTPRPSFLIPAKQARTPRVHLISRCHHDQLSEDDSLLHIGVLDMLQEDFYVRLANAKHEHRQNVDRPGSGQNEEASNRQFVVAESDVCVFLFSDATLEDATCFHDLCTSLAQRIPVVYVRYHRKQLPKTFSETVLRNSDGCVTLKEYVEKHMQDSYSSSPSSASPIKSIRNKNKLAPLTVKHRPKSAHELNARATNARRGKRKHSPVPSEMDLIFTLVNNFKNACVYDEEDFDGCSARLKQSIYQTLGIYETESEMASASPLERGRSSDMSDDTMSVSDSTSTINSLSVNNNNINKNPIIIPSATSMFETNRSTFLSVPDPEDMLSTREWGNSGSRSAPPHGHPSRDYDSEGYNFFFGEDLPMVTTPTLEERSTTYLLFDRNKTPDGPRRVEFPLRQQDSVMTESGGESDEFEAAGSPIDFNDVDLSREVNHRGTPESDISSTGIF